MYVCIFAKAFEWEKLERWNIYGWKGRDRIYLRVKFLFRSDLRQRHNSRKTKPRQWTISLRLRFPFSQTLRHNGNTSQQEVVQVSIGFRVVGKQGGPRTRSSNAFWTETWGLCFVLRSLSARSKNNLGNRYVSPDIVIFSQFLFWCFIRFSESKAWDIVFGYVIRFIFHHIFYIRKGLPLLVYNIKVIEIMFSWMLLLHSWTGKLWIWFFYIMFWWCHCSFQHEVKIIWEIDMYPQI